MNNHPLKTILSLSLDQNILDPQYSNAKDRQLEYASYFKHYIVIVLTTKKYSTLQVENALFIPTNSFTRWLYPLSALSIFVKLKRQYSIDVITAQDPLITGLIAIIVKKLFHYPINLQLHSDFLIRPEPSSPTTLRNKFTNWLIAWELKQADSIRVLTKWQQEQLVKRLPTIKHKTFVSPIKVETDTFKATPSHKQRRKKLLMIGRLSAEKNQILGIQAFKQLLSEFPDLTLTLIGTGPEEANLKCMVKQLKLQQSIIFLGNATKEAVAKQLKQTDVLLLPSLYEGYGLVIIEAMAAGIPIVATKAGSTLIKHNQTGLVSSSWKIEDFAASIRQLLNDPDKSYQLALNAQKELLSTYDPHKILQAWIKGLYETTR